MDIEQLQLILEAARAAGDGAMQVVIIWFVFKFAGLILGYSLGGVITYFVYKLLTSFMVRMTYVGEIESVVGIDLSEYRPKKPEAFSTVVKR